MPVTRPLNPSQNRDDAVDAVDILNDLYNDLFSASALWRSLMRHKAERRLGFQQHILDRVIMSHISIALFKIDELFGHPKYCAVFGNLEVDERRAVRKEIAGRNLRTLRSGYLGHILSDDLGRPLRTSEMERLRERVMRDDMNAFISWVADGQRPVMRLGFYLVNADTSKKAWTSPGISPIRQMIVPLSPAGGAEQFAPGVATLSNTRSLRHVIRAGPPH